MCRIDNNKIILKVIPPAESGVVIANGLIGTGANKYSGTVVIAKNTLTMNIPYAAITANSNVILTVKDPSGQTDAVSVSIITPGVGFAVEFAGYYPTSTGVLNYLVIN